MSEEKLMTATCGKCGGVMEEGVTKAAGLLGSTLSSMDGPRLMFIVSGSPTSLNPVKAFMQGLADESVDRPYGIKGLRCSQCGLLELYAL